MENTTGRSLHNLQADCEKCFGLCCVALYFSVIDGFPKDKVPGEPCHNLQLDFRCGIHKDLRDQGLKGCTAYDCFGAGQKVAQVTYSGQDWRQVPAFEQQMNEVFLIMRQIHELLWYLTEALALEPARSIHSESSSTLEEIESLTHLSPEALMKLDVVAIRGEVNALLLKISELVRAEARAGLKEIKGRQKKIVRGADLIGADLRKTDLRGANLRGAFLIAADLRGVDLTGADLIGADFRDADLRGADLSGSIFLTQAQVNGAKGDTGTRLPVRLVRPGGWTSVPLW